VFGGQAFNASASQVRLSTMLYVLDFSSATPRWRAAQIRLNNQGAFQFDYPNTGVVLLPEFGAVALKHRSVSSSGALLVVKDELVRSRWWTYTACHVFVAQTARDESCCCFNQE